MSEFTRRDFIARAGAAMGSVAAPGALFGGTAEALPPARRRFFKNLSLGRLGFGGTFQQSVDLAQRYGFEGIDPDEKLFASLSDSEMQRLLDGLRAKNLKLASGAFPVNFRRDEVTFNDGLKRLPEVAKTLRRARVDRMNTYVLPCSNSLTYLQNFRQHACRLRECAKVLADYGQRLGLEYVATRTLWRSESQPFIHTMSEMKELEVAIGMDNLGIQLDSWHWYNAQENAADIETLRGRDVITVDLNDAP
ncbi:MAG: sugar phosphate isomerase/epimerase family protein, partial [Terriglobia bacterium]